MKGIQMDAFEDLLPDGAAGPDVPGLPPLSSHEALATLAQWADAGWLRYLDHAFARFLAEVSPDEGAPVLVAAALLVHMEGRGHTCLVIDELVQRGPALLGWPAAPADAWASVAARLPAATVDWLDALRRSAVVGTDDASVRSTTPLVVEAGRLYLRRHWLDERHVAADVAARVTHPGAVDELLARRWLDTLFGATAPDAPFDWQKFACAVALRSRLSVITGGPGTGKTYTAARLLALIWAMSPARDHLRIALAAPTGKAAARLRQSIDGALNSLHATHAGTAAEWMPRLPAARTLHGLLGARPGTRRFAHDAAHPLDVDVLVVDEASMVHLEMMAALLDALPPGARVVLLGDKDQLASVEAGAVLGDLCQGADEGRYEAATCAYGQAVTGQPVPDRFHGDGPPLAQQTVMLRESRRFGGPIGHLALAVNGGHAARAQDLLRDGHGGVLAWPASPTPATAVRLAVAGYRPFTALVRAGPADDRDDTHAGWARSVLLAFDRFRLLCAVRDGDWGVDGLNAAVARALADDGALAARGEWYEGRPVMVTRNLPEAGVFNGDIGIVLRAARGSAGASPWRVYFADGDDVRSVSIGRLAEVDTAFAMTVHKSQGSEFAHTVLVLPDAPSRVLTRELVYTGITRAREQFTLVSGRERALAEALAEQTRRFSGLLDALAKASSGAVLGANRP